MKQRTKQVGQSVEVSPCKNCGQRTSNGRFCSVYCKRDQRFRESSGGTI
jgi:ribosomal protein L32